MRFSQYPKGSLSGLILRFPFNVLCMILQSNASNVSSPRKSDGRTIYYHVADENGDVDDEVVEGYFFTFKGSGVDELTRKLEEATGLADIIVCHRSPLNGKLCPLHLQLPPNNVTMHIVVVLSSSKRKFLS